MQANMVFVAVLYFEIFWFFVFVMSLDIYGRSAFQSHVAGALVVFTPLIGFVYWLIWWIK